MTNFCKQFFILQIQSVLEHHFCNKTFLLDLVVSCFKLYKYLKAFQRYPDFLPFLFVLSQIFYSLNKVKTLSHLGKICNRNLFFYYTSFYSISLTETCVPCFSFDSYSMNASFINAICLFSDFRTDAHFIESLENFISNIWLVNEFILSNCVNIAE